MEEPDKYLEDPCPVGPCPNRYHAARGAEWDSFLERKAKAKMVAGVVVLIRAEQPKENSLLRKLAAIVFASRKFKHVLISEIKNLPSGAD